MSRTLIIQSFRANDVPPWIARCLDSVEQWARAVGHDYQLTDDRAFALCGEDYLSRVGTNLRSITNMCRLELVKRAHQNGYEWAAWIDADIFVFDPSRFSLAGLDRYAFARETWVELKAPGRWRAFSAVNNSVFACRRGEPDLDFLISATRHVALHRQITDNYQVGGSLIKGLRASLAFETLGDVGMFSNYVVLALARDVGELLAMQARLHGAQVRAANLCASQNYEPAVEERQAQAAMDRLEATRGGVVNDWLGEGTPLAPGESILYEVEGLEARLGL
ncbi:MAG: hypothetical protein ACHP84_02690 [Caulobacterales bacterium]